MPVPILILIALTFIGLVIATRRAQMATLKNYAQKNNWHTIAPDTIQADLANFLPQQKTSIFFACTKTLHDLPATLAIYHFTHRRDHRHRDLWGSLLSFTLPTPAPTFQLIGPWTAWSRNILQRTDLTPVPLINFTHGHYQLSILDHHDLEVSQLFSESLIKKLETLPYGVVIEAREKNLYFGSDRYFMTTKEIEELQEVATLFFGELLPKLAILSRNIKLMNDLKKV